MKYFLFLHLLMVLSLMHHESPGQQKADTCHYHVKGTIYDLATKEPLPFATVQLQGTTKGTVADVNGYFFLNTICVEEFDLVFSHIGYKQVVHHHDVHHKLPQIYLAPDDVTLQSVIIEGEVQPGDLSTGTVSSVSSKELALRKNETFGEIVGNIAGVSVIKSGQNVVKPVIHGLHSNRILIINNGVRHEFQSWGQEHAPEIDPSLANNIQVIKGAATVRYGPNALGGVLVINPPKMELLDPLNGEAGITTASNGRSVEGNIRVQKGFHRVALLGEVSYQRQGDLKSADYFLTNTSKEEFSYAVGGRYHVRKWELTTYFSHFYQNLGILRGSVTGNLNDLVKAMEAEIPADTKPFNYQINNPRQQVTHDMFKINAGLIKGGSSYNVQYAFQLNHRQEFDVRRGTNNAIPSIDLELFTHTLEADWKHPEFKDWLGTIGVQAFYQDNNNIPGTNTVPFVPNYNNYRLGAFIIEAKDFDETTLEWGLRYDVQTSSVRGRQPDNTIYRDDLQYHNITATVGIKKQLSIGNFRSNIGSAWRPPGISELFSFGKHQASIEYGLLRYNFNRDGEIEAGNLIKDEEKEVLSERGLKWINSLNIKKASFEAEITGYINYIDNYIFTQPAGITQTVRGAFPFFIYKQTKALLTGFDVSMLIRHNKQFNSQIRGNYLYATDLDNDSYFVELPPPNIEYEVSYERKKWWVFSNMTAGLELDFNFRSLYSPRVIPIREILEAKEQGREIFRKDQAAFDILSPPSGYLLTDIYWTGDLKSWNLLFRINNLLNTRYRTYTDRLRYFADDQGINFILSVKYNF